MLFCCASANPCLRHVRHGDGSGPVSYTHLDVYKRQCRINGIDRELVLYWGDDCPSGAVVGYRNATSIGGPAAKGVYSLSKGDVISFYANWYDENGEYTQSIDFGPPLVVDGDLTVSYTYVGDGACIVYYMLTDIYGNCTWTEPVIAA